MKKALNENNIEFIYVPAGCTGELQPLDVSVNDDFKQKIKDGFNQWYSTQISDQLDSNVDLSKIKVDLRISELKPAHARWVVDAFRYLQSSPQIVLRGFQKTGIEGAIREAQLNLRE